MQIDFSWHIKCIEEILLPSEKTFHTSCFKHQRTLIRELHLSMLYFMAMFESKTVKSRVNLSCIFIYIKTGWDILCSQRIHSSNCFASSEREVFLVIKVYQLMKNTCSWILMSTNSNDLRHRIGKWQFFEQIQLLEYLLISFIWVNQNISIQNEDEDSTKDFCLCFDGSSEIQGRPKIIIIYLHISN